LEDGCRHKLEGSIEGKGKFVFLSSSPGLVLSTLGIAVVLCALYKDSLINYQPPIQGFIRVDTLIRTITKTEFSRSQEGKPGKPVKTQTTDKNEDSRARESSGTTPQIVKGVLPGMGEKTQYKRGAAFPVINHQGNPDTFSLMSTDPLLKIYHPGHDLFRSSRLWKRFFCNGNTSPPAYAVRKEKALRMQ
jgi:hypothetical protein